MSVDLSTIDTDHLASQALKVFVKRYGRLYDTYYASSELYKAKGMIPYEDFYKEIKRFYPHLSQEQADRHSVQQWKQLTGGLPPREVTMLTKQRCIDLCVKGYHSKDEKLITELKTVLVDVGNQLFYLMDIDHDGFMSFDEYTAVTAHFGVDKNLRGSFDTMDLNGDGVVSKEEYLEVFEGFHFYMDEDRFNHLAGILDD